LPATVGVYDAFGLYVPFPDTVAVPTAVPPEVQVVGAEAWGPKTVKVMVPEALEPDVAAKAPEIEPVAMVLPAVPVEGSLVLSVDDALATIISGMPEPQVLASELLFASPP
jgi:hypothetical protein